LSLLDDARRNYSQNPDAAQQLQTIGRSEVPEELDRSELAAWTMVCRALLNLNETITRN